MAVQDELDKGAEKFGTWFGRHKQLIAGFIIGLLAGVIIMGLSLGLS